MTTYLLSYLCQKRCIIFTFRRKMFFCLLWLLTGYSCENLVEAFPLLPILAHFTTGKQVFMLKLWVLGAAQLYFSCRAGVLTSLPRWALTCLASQSVNTRVTYRKCKMLTPEYTEYRIYRLCKVLTPTLLLLTPAPQLPIPGRVFPCLHHRLACLLAGWQKLRGSTGGTRRKVWTQTKILSPNIRYFVAN